MLRFNLENLDLPNAESKLLFYGRLVERAVKHQEYCVVVVSRKPVSP